jgi:hippurate hydrolase
MADMHELVREAQQVLPNIVALRRDIHREPELGLDLPRTQAKVLGALDGLPVRIRTGQRTTSVIADIGRGGDNAIVLRADMDALPLQEDTGLPFASQEQGKMHACGHDAHTAMLVGAAHLLARRGEELNGTVRLMFQPGEEGYGGAVVMLDEGLLDINPQAAFALHAAPRWASGTVLTRGGPCLASSDNFTIVVSGRGGHASMPHLAADPIPVACHIVTALQTLVTRSIHIFEPAVVTVGRIEAGTTYNVIPEIATLKGTIRTVAPGTREKVFAGIARVAENVAAAHGLSATTQIDEGYPVTVNDAAFARFVLDVSERLLGPELTQEMAHPQMAAEDFSYVLERIPGAMASLGSRPPEFGEGDAPNAHSNRYLLDEGAMVNGIAMYAAVALEFLGARS